MVVQRDDERGHQTQRDTEAGHHERRGGQQDADRTVPARVETPVGGDPIGGEARGPSREPCQALPPGQQRLLQGVLWKDPSARWRSTPVALGVSDRRLSPESRRWGPPVSFNARRRSTAITPWFGLAHATADGDFCARVHQGVVALLEHLQAPPEQLRVELAYRLRLAGADLKRRHRSTHLLTSCSSMA